MDPVAPEPPSSEPRRTLIASARRVAGFGMLGAAAVGLLLRLFVRDRLPYLATAYYALPLPVVVTAAALAAICLRGRRRALRAALMLAVVSIVWTLATQCAFRGRTGDADDRLKVVFWNVARGAGGWDAIAEELRATDADLIALVESGRPAERQPFWDARFPDHHAVALQGGMAVLARGEIVSHAHRFLDSGGTANRVVARRQGIEWVIWIVDIHSDPLMPRGPAFVALAEAVERDVDEQPRRPVLVMGDFNTPADSVHVARLGSRLRNAFESAGVGYAATWPTPVPVLSLDQAWVSDAADVARCRHAWTWRSDHRRVELEISTTMSRANPHQTVRPFRVRSSGFGRSSVPSMPNEHASVTRSRAHYLWLFRQL